MKASVDWHRLIAFAIFPLIHHLSAAARAATSGFVYKSSEIIQMQNLFINAREIDIQLTDAIPVSIPFALCLSRANGRRLVFRPT